VNLPSTSVSFSDKFTYICVLKCGVALITHTCLGLYVT